MVKYGITSYWGKTKKKKNNLFGKLTFNLIQLMFRTNVYFLISESVQIHQMQWEMGNKYEMYLTAGNIYFRTYM